MIHITILILIQMPMPALGYKVKKLPKNLYKRFEKYKIENIYLIVALFFGLIFSFLIPHFNSPDEPAHLFRAYEFATGRVKDNDNHPGLTTSMPTNLVDAVRDYTEIYIVRDTYHHENFDRYFHEKIDESKTEIVSSSASNYGPTLYIPQIAGIFIAKTLDLPVVYYMILPRILNLISSILIFYYALKIAPAFKKTLFTLSLLPMTLAQISTASQDGWGMSLSFFFFSLILVAIYKKKLDWKVPAAIFAIALALVIGKSGYIGILPTLFLIPLTKLSRNRLKSFAFVTVVTVLIALCGLGIYFYLMSGVEATSAAAAVPLTDKIKDLIFNPVKFIFVIVNDYYVSGNWYFEQFMGILGWVDTQLPFLYLLLPLFIYLLLMTIQEASETKVIGLKLALKFVILFFVNLLFISTLLYLLWATVVDIPGLGLQGRYFIPSAPFLFVGMGILLNRLIKVDLGILKSKLVLFTIINYAMIVTFIGILKRFYLDF